MIPRGVLRLLSIVTIELLFYIIDFYLLKKMRKEETVTKEEKKVENIHCAICYLQSMNSPEMKFQLYDDDEYCVGNNKYICQKCLDWVNLARKTAAEQAKHPEKNSFENLTWWWQPKVEGISAAEMHVK